MPPQPPKPPRGLPIAVDVVEATAPHTLPPAAPLPPDRREPPVELRKTRPSLAGVPRRPNGAPEEHTLKASPAPPSEPPSEDAVALSERVRDAERARAAAEHDARRLAAELEAERKAKAPPPVDPAEPTKVPVSLWIKVLTPLGGLIVAASAYLSGHTAVSVPPKLENTEERTKNVEKVTSNDHELVLSLQKQMRESRAYQKCINMWLASAARRSGGHNMTFLPDTGAQWVEQRKPPAKSPVYYESPVWISFAPPCPEPNEP